MGAVGNAELRQGAARTDCPRGPRDAAGPVPERPGRGAVVEPIGADRARQVMEAALEAGGDAVEVLLFHSWGGLTRFADSAIHQSTWREDTSLRIRVVDDGRVAVASTNEFTPQGVAQASDGFRAAGSYETGAAEIALLNSEGQFCYGPTTQASVTSLVSGGDGGAGYVEAWSVGAGGLDLEA